MSKSIYAKTTIYKIVCNNPTICETYIGHTTDFLSRRNRHKNDCTNANSKHHNYKVYQFIRANGGWNNFQMIELEQYQCADANEAREKERLWYERIMPSLNSNVPYRTRSEVNRAYYEKTRK